MATADSNFFEIKRRGIRLNKNTTLDDGITSLLWDDDPNAALGTVSRPSQAGEQKLISMLPGADFFQSNGKLWLKTAMPNVWTDYSSGSAVGAKKLIFLVGDGVETSFQAAHVLATDDLDVSVYDAATGQKVETGVTIGVGYVTIDFAMPPAIDAYKVVILG
jgi:hypothetical protein